MAPSNPAAAQPGEQPASVVASVVPPVEGSWGELPPQSAEYNRVKAVFEKQLLGPGGLAELQDWPFPVPNPALCSKAGDPADWHSYSAQFVPLGLQQRLGPRLQPECKLPCPACGQRRVHSDGWQWSRIHKLQSLRGPMYVLSCKYFCPDCTGEWRLEVAGGGGRRLPAGRR